MTNRDRIENKIKSLGYEVGCCDEMLNILTTTATNKVLGYLNEEYTDVFITMRRNADVVVEISTVDNEKDVIVYSMTDYFKMYGNLEEALDNGKISQSKYNQIKRLL